MESCANGNVEGSIRPSRLMDSPITWFLAGAILLAGCSRPAPPPEDLFEAPVPACGLSASEKLQVRVYVDASGSMQGFTVPQPTSRYVQFLQELRLGVGTRWGAGQVQCFRFGERVAPIPNLLAGLEPAFYQDRETRIDEPLGKADARALTILVTDLFQNNADVVALIEALRAKFMPARLALGIWGLRSEFDGRIYGVGPTSLNFVYRSKGDPKTFRPFYLIAAGRTPTCWRCPKS